MLQAGQVAATVIANENRLRLSVSVFNTHDDIDRVVAVLGGKTSSIQIVVVRLMPDSTGA